jgi:hypothetical protein
MNANRTIYGCDCGSCADCRPDLHKKENECVVCGCYNLTSFKKLCYTGIHCLGCYYEKYGDSDNEDYCCCCRNPDEGLDGGCPCGCHDEEGGESDDEEDNRECCEMCGDKTSNDEWTDYLGNKILYCFDCYDKHRVRIERKCTECNFRQSSPDTDLCKICDPEEDYESANCETCGENYLLDKLEVEEDKFYCRLCVVV